MMLRSQAHPQPSSVAKGNVLEQAVRVIETVILRTSPGYQENTFTISSKKQINIKGVRREIDIWVEIDLGKFYKSLFILNAGAVRKKLVRMT
jgi:hypothetical protein